MLRRDLTGAEFERIRSIELRADLRVLHFRLLASPCHLAVWTVLASTVQVIEENYARFGPDSSQFSGTMLNLARYGAMLVRWLKAETVSEVPPNWVPAWDPVLGRRAEIDIRTVLNYDAFQCSYPMWHSDRVHGEVINDNLVRFTVDGGVRERQVSAYHKGMRPQQGVFKAVPGRRMEPSVGALRRYQRVLDGARGTDPFGFEYEHPFELARRTKNNYDERLTAILRRSESIELGGYTLAVFKEFYSALQAICAIHDYLCFRWMRLGHPYPFSSGVLVKQKSDWVRLLSNLAGVDSLTTERLIGDLTFYSRRLPDFHVYPFVPLTDSREILALVPQFVLNAAPEDNILRTCSYLRPDAYSLLSNDKEATMRDVLVENLGRFNVGHSIPLPDGSSEIDLLIEDEASSTVVISELKWYRKPSTYRERLRADERFLDGQHRQLGTIRQFCRDHPCFLKERNRLRRSLADYEHVYYILIAKDHWVWVEPQDQTCFLDFEQFRCALERHASLHAAVSELLEYGWLPVEGRDFHVRHDRGAVEGVGVESEIFYGGQAAVLSVA
jgi:hypothetical protein